MVTFGFFSPGFLVGRSMKKPSRGNVPFPDLSGGYQVSISVYGQKDIQNCT